MNEHEEGSLLDDARKDLSKARTVLQGATDAHNDAFEEVQVARLRLAELEEWVRDLEAAALGARVDAR